jgi:hypothetical protein
MGNVHGALLSGESAAKKLDESLQQKKIYSALPGHK